MVLHISTIGKVRILRSDIFIRSKCSQDCNQILDHFERNPLLNNRFQSGNKWFFIYQRLGKCEYSDLIFSYAASVPKIAIKYWITSREIPSLTIDFKVETNGSSYINDWESANTQI